MPHLAMLYSVMTRQLEQELGSSYAEMQQGQPAQPGLLWQPEQTPQTCVPGKNGLSTHAPVLFVMLGGVPVVHWLPALHVSAA